MRTREQGIGTATVAAIVLGIAAAVAGPRISGFVAESQSTYQADAFVATLKFAQSEAVKREASVSVRATAGEATSFAGGWLVWEDLNADGVPDAGEPVLMRHAALDVRSFVAKDGTDALTFAPSGFMQVASGDARMFELCYGGAGSPGRAIRVKATGRAVVTKQRC
jgi:type IV fimbrial biogenesis protein FimT